MGHEAVGIVDELSDGVSNFIKGDRVVVICDICCGLCSYAPIGQFQQRPITNRPLQATNVLAETIHCEDTILGPKEGLR